MLQAGFFLCLACSEILNRIQWVKGSKIPDTGDLSKAPKGLKCWTAVWEHLVCWREILQESVSISFKRITVENEAPKSLIILVIEKLLLFTLDGVYFNMYFYFFKDAVLDDGIKILYILFL